MRRHTWKWAIGAALATALSATPALAELSNFLGEWAVSRADADGIARVVVSRTGADSVNVQVFGKCEPAECDWGTVPGHLYSEGPGLAEVRAVGADFKTAFGTRRLVLRQERGNIRFDMLTDFTGTSARNGYLASGPLHRPGTPDVETGPTLGAATGFFASTGRDSDSGCVTFNRNGAYLAPDDRGSKYVDFSHTILRFGAYKSEGVKAKAVIDSYQFDEQCVVGHGRGAMMYWKAQGAVPTADLAGQDCISVDHAAVKAVAAGESWTVADGARTLLDYEDDRAAAEQAAATIKLYRFTRQCRVGQPKEVMQYWIAK